MKTISRPQLRALISYVVRLFTFETRDSLDWEIIMNAPYLPTFEATQPTRIAWAKMFALAFGAPFWFDLLGKLVNIRKSGLKPLTHKVKT